MKKTILSGVPALALLLVLAFSGLADRFGEGTTASAGDGAPTLEFVGSARAHDDATPAALDRDAGSAYAGATTLLETGETVIGQPLVYPRDGSAKLTALEITLEPGQSTGRHLHEVPLFAYLLEGTLEVDYEGHGTRTFGPGEALIEAVGVWHDGRAVGDTPAKVLAVFLGSSDEANVIRP